jgi:hypothetical protein
MLGAKQEDIFHRILSAVACLVFGAIQIRV